MSIRSTDPGDFSLETRALFRSALADHAPCTADRERVRAALARRVADGSDAPAPVSGRVGATLENLAKLLGLAVVMAGAYVIARGGDVKTTEEEVQTPLPTVAGANLTEAEPPRAESRPAALAIDAPAPTLVARRESVLRVESAEPAVPPRRGAGARSRVRVRVPDARPTPPFAAATSAAAQSTSLDAKPAASEGADTVSAGRGIRVSEIPPSAERAPAVVPPEMSSAVPRALVVPSTVPRTAAAPSSPPTARHTASPALEPVTRDPRAELAFVQRIHAAMRANARTRVLALCAEHQRRWPEGTFVQEREGLRALASCGSGTLDAADRARAFLDAYPRGPLAPRVRQACASQVRVREDPALVLPGVIDDSNR